jgi:hypothetical protein
MSAVLGKRGTGRVISAPSAPHATFIAGLPSPESLPAGELDNNQADWARVYDYFNTGEAPVNAYPDEDDHVLYDRQYFSAIGAAKAENPLGVPTTAVTEVTGDTVFVVANGWVVSQHAWDHLVSLGSVSYA